MLEKPNNKPQLVKVGEMPVSDLRALSGETGPNGNPLSLLDIITANETQIHAADGVFLSTNNGYLSPEARSSNSALSKLPDLTGKSQGKLVVAVVSRRPPVN